MNNNRLLDLAETRDFRTLFIDELGWNNPDWPRLTVTASASDYTLDQIAGYKGLRIWHCPSLPPRPIQREIDILVGRDSHERLIIFSGEQRQDWRWPRRTHTSGVNAKLLVHPHLVGEANPDLAARLESIALDFDEDVPLVELLERMREAFDRESESASVQAARLMGTLYTELENCWIEPEEATLLLARLLFLLFGDDAEMWEQNLFHEFLTRTGVDTLHDELDKLFAVVNTPEHQRTDAAADALTRFPYINGGLYADPLPIPPLTEGFRDGLLKASSFDWSIISPAIFGSMFQTVKDKEARRGGGEHYTTEENILKTIRPLFLDEYEDRLAAAWDDKARLTELHHQLGRLRVFDPACGCGNFLIVAYRELRALELELLKRRRALDQLDRTQTGRDRHQLSFDLTADLQVRLDHFYGIEIEEWPARIAETAMLLVDHLANQRMEQDFGIAPNPLPITVAPAIVHGNALHTDWYDVVTPDSDADVIIVGNPPFTGQYTKTAAQTADTKAVWGRRYNGYLDYVTCWYAKALDYYRGDRGRWAFVSTNSICQGEAVEFLWRPILDAGWRCRFAHRSFQWSTEAPEGAAVHVSIIGFDQKTTPKPIIYTYPEGGKGSSTPQHVNRINPYLIEGPNVLISSRTKPLSPSLELVTKGNQPTDDGNFIVTLDAYAEVAADPIAAKYLRPFIGARELLYDRPRWCLWLEGATSAEINGSPILRARVAAVQKKRSASTKAATREKASTPHLFDERRQPLTSYLAIPRHVGEHRRYFPAGRYGADVICSDANFLASDPDGFLLGVLSSSMFIAWMRAIGGRIKSDLRFSNTFAYNTFPLPSVTRRQRRAIVDAAAGVIAAREAHHGASLATLYDPDATPPELLDAHATLDKAVDSLFGRADLSNEAARQRTLFRHYGTLTGQERLL